MASMVTKAPLRSKSFKSSGIALISFDLPSTATSPKLNWAWLAQALTMCSGFFLAVAEPRRVLPSMARWLRPTRSDTSCSQAMQQRLKTAGSSLAKTRSKVSCEGMPLDNFKKRLNQPIRLAAKSTMSVQPSQLAMTPHRAMATISNKQCSVRPRTRGSLRVAKYFFIEPTEERAAIADPPERGRPPCESYGLYTCLNQGPRDNLAGS